MILLDMPSVSGEQEAEALMLYHLKMAATYFEATGLSIKIPEDEFSATAIQQWVLAMEALYPEDEE